jgi:hypothetical protein
VLTKVKGDFSGYGEKVYLTIEKRGNPTVDMWILRGESQKQGVGGGARCFKKSGFLANGPERWNSPEWRARTDGRCGSASASAWGGHAGTFLSGLGGKFEGGAERVRIAHSSYVTRSSTVFAEGCQGAMEVRARSFFAGELSTTSLANYTGPVYNVEGSSYCTNTFNREVQMAESTWSMCHLVYVGGDFGGGGEVAQIHDYAGYWYLRVTAGPRNPAIGECGRYIRAQARCYMRDQRH